jgi:hypothetical protein
MIFIVLHSLGIAALLIGFTTSFEILWRAPQVPDLEIIFEKYSIQHANVKSFLFAVTGAFLINQVVTNLVIVGESFLLILLASLIVANRKYASVLLQYVMSFAATLALAALVYTFTAITFLADSILVAYPSFMIIAIFLLWRSGRNPYRQSNWHLLAIIVALLVSMGWYIIYETFESAILLVPTFISVFLLVELKIPESDWKSKSELIPVISSLILLTEILWVWHATIFFTMESNLIFIGTGFFLLLAIFYPLSEAIDVYTFRKPWKLVSGYTSLCLGGLFTGWNILSLQLPYNPLLTLSVGFILYSMLVTPFVRIAEKNVQLEDYQPKAPIEWIPAIIGFTTFALQFGISTTTDIRLTLGIGLLGFSLAGVVFILLKPNKLHPIALIVNLSLATSLSVIFWCTNEPLIDSLSLILCTMLIWIVVSLPVTHEKIISFISLCIRVISENKVKVVFAFPIILGFLIGLYRSLTISQIALMDMILLWSFSLLLIPAFLYYFGTHLFEENIAMKLQKPMLVLLGLGLFLSFLILGLGSYILSEYPLIVTVALSLSITLLILTLVSFSLGLHEFMRKFYGTMGIVISPIVYTIISIKTGSNVFYAIPVTILLVVAVEAPLFSYQLKLLVKMLTDLGLLFRTLVQKFNNFIKYIFDKYGFIAWTVFSIAFVVIFAILSYPFFSELLNMPIVGFLYVIPNISFPTMILGLMLLFIGIVRRKVKSSFGSVSGFLSILGFGMTAFCGLYENGYPYLAAAFTVLSICLLALILRRELDVGEEYFLGGWIPIPLSVMAIILYYLYIPSIALEGQILAILLSAFPACCMYIASSYVSWVPISARKPLWILLSVLSGTIAYLSSYLAFFPPLAAIYLSVFIASFVMYPVTGRKMIHLFFAPLFFALTGFAFTLLFGEFYQNLLVALASALFFVSRYVKEKRDEHPNLIYIAWIRVAILVVLLLCVGVFVISVLSSIIPIS